MEEKKKKELLKNIPFEVLKLLHRNLFEKRDWRGETNLIDMIENAEYNGLLYVAERINPNMKILCYENEINSEFCSEKEKNLYNFGKNQDNKENFIEIGSGEFLEKYTADAYFIGICGCGDGKVDTKELLKYGQIFYIVGDIGCNGGFGYPFGKDIAEVLGYEGNIVVGRKQGEEARQMVYQKKLVRELTNKMVEGRKYERLKLDISDSLKHRLHYLF
tara:strand:- start:250 stop:903 length:654 start_codon:yes stop_codon:yes gene_type:complete